MKKSRWKKFSRIWFPHAYINFFKKYGWNELVECETLLSFIVKWTGTLFHGQHKMEKRDFYSRTVGVNNLMYRGTSHKWKCPYFYGTEKVLKKKKILTVINTSINIDVKKPIGGNNNVTL